MNLIEIETLTSKYGEGWGAAHVRRVLHLIEQIGSGMAYDRQVVQYAAWLHDWGAFPNYAQPGVDHALRSRQIAEAEILPQTGLSPARQALILEAIELHDYRNEQPGSSVEALLLREADLLDFLGVIGIVREFAWGPNDLQRCCERVERRLEAVRGRLSIPAAQAIARQRISEMEIFLARLKDESFSYL
jgi:uncharacterized protein